MWRNPVTNRFEAGDPPVDGVGQPDNATPQEGAFPTATRAVVTGTDPWDYIATPGTDSDGTGVGEVHAVGSVLDVGAETTQESVMPYKSRPIPGVPRG
jgi:hypothetical protein